MTTIEEELIKSIPGMFGQIDCLFAGHPLEKKRAIETINYAFYNYIPQEKFVELCKEYLSSQNCSSLHIETQINKLQKIKINPYNKRQIASCWLISIEVDTAISALDGSKILDEESIINIVDSRKSADSIIDYINFYVSSTLFTAQQKLAYQQRKSIIPQLPLAKLYKINGIGFEGLIIFEKQDYFIVGRRVKNLNYIQTGNDKVITFYDCTYKNINKIKQLLSQRD